MFRPQLSLLKKLVNDCVILFILILICDIDE
jgi:hypothetical protein